MNAIEVKGLTKYFGKICAVDGVDLSIPKGHIMGFLGPNGSGKTTTIRLLCGLLKPDAGEGTCLGFNILTESSLIKKEVGYMTQTFSLYEELSVEENLNFIARMYNSERLRETVTDTMKTLELWNKRQQIAGTLSGGWKQKLSLAACLTHNPKLLLLDEPTAGVDPKTRRDFWERLHQLAASKITVLVSTHYMDEAECCHELAYIAYGKLLAKGPVEEVKKAFLAYPVRHV